MAIQGSGAAHRRGRCARQRRTTGFDCTPAAGQLPRERPPCSRSFAADGVINAVVQNTTAVDFFCTVTVTTVRLTYFLSTTSIDFGTVFLGSCRTEA